MGVMRVCRSLLPLAALLVPAALAAGASGCGARTGLRSTDDGPPATACASLDILAERADLDVFLLLDTSNSMGFVTTDQLSKLEAVRLALGKSLASAAGPSGRVALGHFPPGDDSTKTAFCFTSGACPTCEIADLCPLGCTGPSCEVRCALRRCESTEDACETDVDCPNGDCRSYGSCGKSPLCAPSSYATPLLPLTAAASPSIVATLEALTPAGPTPTVPAYATFLSTAVDASATSPNRTIVVLVTDGVPSVCHASEEGGLQLDHAVMETHARRAVAAGVPTFVLAIFTPEEEIAGLPGLSKVAAAGGTDQPFVIAPDGSLSGAFAEALKKIREDAVVCDFALPNVAPKKLDPLRISVVAAGQELRLVDDAAACFGEAFYLVGDGGKSGPSRLVLCPDACALARTETTITIRASCDGG